MPETVVVRCHCGNFTEECQLQDAIPLDGLMCHCNICRHATGALTFTGVALTDPPINAIQSKLVKYATSERIWRFFCPTCGSQPCYTRPGSERWHVCAGAIDEIKRDTQGKLENITGHEFVADTIDGGLSWCLPDVPSYLEGDNEEPSKDIKADLAQLRGKPTGNEDRLLAECHCGQVKLHIERPDDGGKWNGGLCACRSCRLSFSQTLVAWLSSIPYEKVTWHDGATYDGGARNGIGKFESSDHAYREFCKTCGASVSWSSSKEPGIVEIAAGLLRAKEGALAKSWIKWRTSSIHHTGDAIDKVLVKTLERNLAALEID